MDYNKVWVGFKMRTSIPYFKNPTDAYRYMLEYINRHGDTIIDENHQLTRELMNIQITIQDPCNPENWPIKDTGWKLPALDEYVRTEILGTKIPAGFLYTYGNRLFVHPPSEMNQIEVCIRRLKDRHATRRAIAGTLSPEYDCNVYLNSIPCLQLIDFLIRDGKLHLTAVFRSWDVKRAAPSNLYGLNKLMKYVAEKVGVPTGELTVFAISAHIYED